MGEALETVRRQHDAFLREDWEAFFALYHPEVEIDLSRSGIPGGGVHHGHEGILEGWTQWRGAWDDYGYEVEELTELGVHGAQRPDRALRELPRPGRGAAQGRPRLARVAAAREHAPLLA
jgi:ketosteroid isomerase-like protein